MKNPVSFILVFALYFQTGCQYLTLAKDRMVDDGTTCSESLEQMKKKSDMGSLNMVRDLYYRSCYDETIQVVKYARLKFRDSVISITQDTAEVVAFEGTFTDYVMESYERTYLSLLAVRF